MASQEATVQRETRRSVSSLERKRSRDRRAQKNLRQKRAVEIKNFEERVAQLEGRVMELRHRCGNLQRENATLRARQEAVQNMFTIWADQDATSSSTVGKDGIEGASEKENEEQNHLEGQGDTEKRQSPVEVIHVESESISSTPLVQRSPPEASSIGGAELVLATAPMTVPVATEAPPTAIESFIPIWYLTPYHENDDIFIDDSFRQWFGRPELVLSSPDSPLPMELLYGSSANFLANAISETTRRWPCADKERLAGGWLAYHYCKWLMQPTNESFSHLQQFQTPVGEQLFFPHPYFIDLWIWPKLRSNMIRHQKLYDVAEVSSAFMHCFRLSWPSNERILESDSGGVYRMRQEFYNTFICLESWYLTDEFGRRYPQLTEGLDSDDGNTVDLYTL